MAARSIFVTWPMEAEVRAILDRVGAVRTSHTERELPVPELARHVADVEAIIPMGAHPTPEPVLAAAPRLRIVAVAAVGYNIVDEAALVEALRSKRIAGAGLDVFEEEPKVHPDLLGLENLALTPHIGSASGATRRRMATRAAENCVAALEGHRPPDLVNPEAWRPA